MHVISNPFPGVWHTLAVRDEYYGNRADIDRTTHRLYPSRLSGDGTRSCESSSQSIYHCGQSGPQEPNERLASWWVRPDQLAASDSQ